MKSSAERIKELRRLAARHRRTIRELRKELARPAAKAAPRPSNPLLDDIQDTLAWLDMLGGLGYEKHDKLRRLLKRIAAEKAAR